MAKAIMRFAKLKTGNLPGSVAHVARQIETPNADPERTAKNLTIGNQDTRSAVLERVEQVTGGKHRKDAVVAYEFIMTAKAEWFADKSGKEVKQWANASLRWIRKIFGSENMVSATLHLDEAAPHIHAYVVPEFQGRLCAKAYTGTRKLCSDLQTSYAKAVEIFGLERGLKGSKAVHIPPKQFHSLVNNQKIPELPGRLSSSTTREEYEQTIAMLLAKHQAEAKRFEKANQQLSKLLSNIGNQDVNHINQAVREFGNLKNQFEETRNYLDITRSHLAKTREELHQYQETFKELGIRDTNHLKAMISTANSIIERERERKRNSERTPGIVPGES